MLLEAAKAVDDLVASPLSRALQRVRALKEDTMPRGPDKYRCTICGKYANPAKRYVKTHISSKHQDVLAGSKDTEKYVEEIEPETLVEEEVSQETPEETPEEAAAPASPPVEAVPDPEPVEETPATVVEVSPPEMSDVMLAGGEADITTEGNPDLWVTPPPPPTPPPRLLSVPLGSALIINGSAFWQNPGTKSWEPSEASHLTVQVVGKQLVPQGDVLVICRAEQSTGLWAVPEIAVLNGSVKILKLAPVKPSMGALGFKPEDGECEFEDPEYDYFEEERSAEEQRQRESQEKEQFLKDVKEYLVARDAAKKAAVEFDKVRKTHRESIMNYVRAHGTPPENGRSGVAVREGGFEVHISETPAPTFVDRDEARIQEWLADNGYDSYLRVLVDFEKWEDLKDEKGSEGEYLVPREFVREVEQSKTGQVEERLLINPLPE